MSQFNLDSHPTSYMCELWSINLIKIHLTNEKVALASKLMTFDYYKKIFESGWMAAGFLVHDLRDTNKKLLQLIINCEGKEFGNWMEK